MPDQPLPDQPLYERDFFAWTQEQAAALRRLAADRANLPLDADNLAEEIESMGRSDARAVESHLARILEHLAKLEWSTAAEPRQGWRASVVEQRLDCLRVLDDSPSLKARFQADDLARPWRAGRRMAEASLQAHSERPVLPEACPYRFEQALDENWWPVNRHGLGGP